MLQVHDRLGDFEIIRLIGKGGMGEVYEARQSNPDRPVAIKVLAPWLADDEESLKRFMREANVPANLDHPGIVRIISTGKTDSGIAYYAMHLVRGISLTEMIKRAMSGEFSKLVTRDDQRANTPSMSAVTLDETSGADKPPPSPVPKADSEVPLLEDYKRDRFTAVARIGAQAARALAYAHQQGHLHRDIKPSNLMIDRHNHVYLVDFGLTRGLQPAGEGTLPGVLVGTPWYMSPEQAESNSLDERSDIYSLGVTLFELATQGLGPFTASRDNKASVLEQVRAGQILPLRTLAPGIPAALEKIILKAMHLKPAKRYASAEELACELEVFLGAKPKPAPPPSPPAPPKRRWPIWIAGGVVAAAVIVSVAVAINNRRNEPVPEVPNSKPKPDGSQAFPLMLRQAEVNVPISLLKATLDPVWQEGVYGTGRLRPTPEYLGLNAPPNETCTMFALADPDRHAFLIEIQLWKHPAIGKGRDNDMGIFFGWRRESGKADDPTRFFVVQLEEEIQGKNKKRRLVVGTGSYVKATGTRVETMQFYKAHDKIPVPDATKTWHNVKVRVEGDRFQVGVDNEIMRNFEVATLAQSDGPTSGKLSTNGALGIWVRNGNGNFRSAVVTALQD